MRKAKRSAPGSSRRSPCPVACTLDLLGDRWSMLIIRDLFAGKQRYGEFLDSDEGIPTNVLAERLKRLEAAGVIRGERYQHHPPRYAYRLTAKGEELKPILGLLARWGLKNVPKTKTDERLAGLLAALPPS